MCETTVKEAFKDGSNFYNIILVHYYILIIFGDLQKKTFKIKVYNKFKRLLLIITKINSHTPSISISQ